MIGRRIRDWLVGRHEFRGIAVVDPVVAKAHGGRPIPGTYRAEFVQAATGPLRKARLEAARALHARLAAQIPDARLEVLLDGGPAVDPEPRLRPVKGGRPRTYLGAFGLVRTDVQISLWAQWSLGVSALAVALLSIYLGVAYGVIGRRFGVDRWLIALLSVPIAAFMFMTAAAATTDNVLQRAQVNATGLPRPLFGLQPRLACVVPVDGQYSYVGQLVDPASGPVVYFGRADGRLAVWSERSGGVLLDGQAVGLRFVQPGSTCAWYRPCLHGHVDLAVCGPVDGRRCRSP